MLKEEQGHFQHPHQYIVPKNERITAPFKNSLNHTQHTMFRKASNGESFVEAVKNLADLTRKLKYLTYHILLYR